MVLSGSYNLSGADRGTFRFYRGMSMRGTFRPGDCLIVEGTSLCHMRSGDVIVFRGTDNEGRTSEVVHRVVRIALGGLVVQGDNSAALDNVLVGQERLVGKVTHIERNGNTSPVWGGHIGLFRARVLHLKRRGLLWLVKGCRLLGKRPYRWLCRSGLVPRYGIPV